MKNKVKKNLLLIGLLLGVILFCALRDCTFMEGFREGVKNRDDDDDDDTKEYEDQKKKEKENPGFLANLEGAAKGVAKGAGTLVRKTKEVVRTAKSASNNETLDETIEKEKKARKK